MADVLMLLEEQRGAIRDAERELAEATAAKTEWERKVAYLQWQLERLKRLYSLTSGMAHETASPQTRLQIPGLADKPQTGRPGTIKQAIIEVLREHHRAMLTREIWEALEKRGIKSESDRPVEVVASVMRSSIARHQNIFTKDGTKFGLVEWQGGRST